MTAPDIYGADGETTTAACALELGIQRDGRHTPGREALPATQNFNATHRTRWITLPTCTIFAVMAGYQSGREPLLISLQLCHSPHRRPTPALNLGRATTAVDTRNSWSTRGFTDVSTTTLDARYLRSQHALRRHIALCQNNRWGFFPSVSVG